MCNRPVPLCECTCRQKFVNAQGLRAPWPFVCATMWREGRAYIARACIERGCVFAARGEPGGPLTTLCASHRNPYFFSSLTLSLLSFLCLSFRGRTISPVFRCTGRLFPRIIVYRGLMHRRGTFTASADRNRLFCSGNFVSPKLET